MNDIVEGAKKVINGVENENSEELVEGILDVAKGAAWVAAAVFLGSLPSQ